MSPCATPQSTRELPKHGTGILNPQIQAQLTCRINHFSASPTSQPSLAHQKELKGLTSLQRRSKSLWEILTGSSHLLLQSSRLSDQALGGLVSAAVGSWLPGFIGASPSGVYCALTLLELCFLASNRLNLWRLDHPFTK